jgi:hypothetical protein
MQQQVAPLQKAFNDGLTWTFWVFDHYDPLKNDVEKYVSVSHFF